MRSWLASCALFAYFHLELVSSSLDVFGHARRFRRIRRGSTDDIELLGERRFPAIAANSEGSAANVGTWLGTLEENGQWPASEVNYGTGCDAQRSNWPAQDHWSRIVTMSAAWHGGLSGAEEWAQNDTLRDAISLAMEYWFANDMALPQCADHGGDNLCPCGTPGFWNTNWYGNFIGVPTLVEEACVMLNGSLTETEFGNCSVFAYRSFDSMETGINGGSTTGANGLDISSIAVDFGIVSANATLLTEAFDDIHKDVVIINEKKADGIRADGAFSQHLGIIYNGNYGKDYFNDVLNLEVIAGGTQYAASQESRDAVTTLVEGNSWMIYVNTLTGVLHWDYSVIGRFIAVPVADNAASASIHTNLTKVQVLADEWDSSEMRQYYEALTSESDNANIGDVQGNRMFYTLDYMVHRGPGYVTTLKMLSKRTQTSECTNSQSPYGFHLSDGAMFTYMDGDEYEDIFASWDWNLIPGITVDYNATVLACNSAGASGTQDLAGGVSNGEIGVAAMHYKTPKSKSLESRKAWFFLPNDVQHVMIASINSTTNASVFSILDQRLHSGDIFVDGKREIEGNFTGVSTLFHSGVGYAFNQSNNAVSLSIQSGERTGNWSTLSASKQGLETVDLFSAWLYHEDPSEPAEYTIFPATTKHSFSKKLHETDLITLSNDDMVSALLDRSNGIVMSVFWEAEGGEMTIPGDDPWAASVTVTSDGNVALIIDLCDFYLTVSDPSQTLANVTLTFTVDDDGYPPHGWQGHDSTASVTIQLPSGGLNGSSVSTALF